MSWILKAKYSVFLNLLCMLSPTKEPSPTFIEVNSFNPALKADISQTMYERFLSKIRESYPVQDGEFGAMMQVDLVNDGPVTLVIDSQDRQF